MKIQRYLTVASKQFEVVEELVILEMNAAGRATFTALSDDALINRFDLVTFELNYTRFDTLQRLFVGYVDSITRIDARQVKLFCREISGLFGSAMPIALRHPDLSDVTQALSDFTNGIEFTLPDQPYSAIKIPHFSNVGSGYNALNALGKLFKIPDYVWQQQDDGSIYVGSWQDGGFQSLDVDDDLFFDQIGNQSASVLALPTLRAGAMVNNNRIKQLAFSENTMTLTWE